MNRAGSVQNMCRTVIVRLEYYFIMEYYPHLNWEVVSTGKESYPAESAGLFFA
ncbi:hypothetical protein GM661_04155 [Iocasia frigidifontis]|uniref:Uncharacterized protein n=1 Tax=Iocasia fonsfrigidae TaxID=2682810 RepID=A0A8A7K686_9FIRM|nr:hypothetical protein GM661_04155 [Iocasia fonsfrigidae]